MMSVTGIKKIEKMNFDGYAREMAHSKVRNKRLPKAAHMLKKTYLFTFHTLTK